MIWKELVVTCLKVLLQDSSGETGENKEIISFRIDGSVAKILSL